uniref:NADH dehydrogenase subunit 1 n=1 Tax=Neorhodella cyanea TaxID=131155 RepID=UPI001FCCFAE7|nr:NADH dehydrogenase subunit 1 [Neorhodella cyanea]UNJ18806.1 NADH dehydrogenase subunit 1 [Neorhodella cyanea]
MFIAFLKFFSIILPLLISIAYLTLIERKIMAFLQSRKGPNLAGYFGLFQPLIDGLKLFVKEITLPLNANTFIFIFAPLLTFFLALLVWCIIPIFEGFVFIDLNIGVLYLFSISSLGVYGIIFSGWSSNSKYAFLGALRSTAQMISYEIAIGLILISTILCSGSLNLSNLILAQYKIWFFIPLFPLFLMFFLSCLAENNRAPFDLPEAEAELVAGYNVEYSSINFALFFLGEYANMIFMCSLIVICFLGGWFPFLNFTFLLWVPGFFWFSFKVILILFLYIWVRACLPRVRYDNLMRLGWKIFLPLTLGFLMIVTGLMLSFNLLPN